MTRLCQSHANESNCLLHRLAAGDAHVADETLACQMCECTIEDLEQHAIGLGRQLKSAADQTSDLHVDEKACRRALQRAALLSRGTDAPESRDHRPAASRDESEAVNRVLGNYVVLEQIGQGGMGQVFKARHQRMKRIVALKILPRQTIVSVDAVERFRREVETAARLEHPNIVTAYDADEADGVHFLVMQYVPGKDLAKVVQEHGPLPVESAVECILQVARGLAYAHEHGVIHRDIKPANLLLSDRGRVKILDMGLARWDEQELGREATAAPMLTQSGQMMGTVDYMSPEQAEDTRSADHRTDVYALGCTLYRLLIGAPPFEADSVMRKLLAHRDAPIPSLCAARSEVPAALDAVYQRMLAKDPNERQQSMAEVIAGIEAAMGRSASRGSAAYDESPSGGLSLFFSELMTCGPATARKQQALTSVGEETVNARSTDGTDTAVRRRVSRSKNLAEASQRTQLLVAVAALGVVALGAILWTNREEVPAPTAVADLASSDDPRPSAESHTITSADGWIDLTPAVDLAADTLAGKWEPDAEGIRNQWGIDRLRLPLRASGAYEVKFEFTVQTSRPNLMGCILPVAGKRVVLKIENVTSNKMHEGGWQVPGVAHNYVSLAEGPIKPTTRQTLHVRVESTGEHVVVLSAELEGWKYPEVSVARTELADTTDTLFTAGVADEVVLSVRKGHMVVHRLEWRQLAGESTWIRPLQSNL